MFYYFTECSKHGVRPLKYFNTCLNVTKSCQMEIKVNHIQPINWDWLKHQSINFTQNIIFIRWINLPFVWIVLRYLVK